MTPPVRALLANLIDYAGLYPPAALPLPEVLANYQRYLSCEDAWVLNRLVLPLDQLAAAEPDDNWRITLLVDGEPGPLPLQVETLETRQTARLSLPTYCEAPLDQVQNAFAKIRTATASATDLAQFLVTAAQRRVPFKATAGLHHPLRSATMHGFLNVFAGAVLVWRGMDLASLTQLLEDTDPRAFDFAGDTLRWRDWRASTAEITEARRDFAHSFGSCSFEEPLHDLRTMGLLP